MPNSPIPFVIDLRLLGLVFALSLFQAARAQTFNVAGSVFDDADGSTLPGASVLLIDANDTTQRRSAISDGDGHFSFSTVSPGTYQLRASFVGYAQLDQPVKINADMLGATLRLKTSSTQLKVVEKVATQARAEQKGDTTIFNAGAYKVNPDATAEDLLTKMPGVTSQNGTVTAQGEQVKRVLVDGREFFGDDATIALKNLPAEVIDKVQVFDKQSDQAQFTGFDDGNSEKTLNIVTKKGMNKGVFGNASLGYGTDDRYTGNLSLNWFNGARRFSLLGQSNNINQQNFSAQDLVGVSSGSAGGQGGRGGGNSANNFLVGTQPGINTTNALGLNYSDQIGKTKLTGSYFFNEQRSVNTSSSDRTTFLSDTTAQVTNSYDDQTADNFNHRFSFRIETQFDSANSLIITPKLGFQRNTSENSQLSRVADGDSVQLSTTDNESKTERDGLTFSNSLLFRHKFAKRGRTFSANLNTSLSSRNSTGTLLADNSFLLDTAALATSIDQRSTGDNFTQNHGLQLNYTEPVSRKGQLQFSVAPSIQLSNAKKLTYDIDPDTGDELLNTLLSNDAENTIRTLRGGASYRYRGTGYMFNIGLDGQGSDMHSEQTFPFEYPIDRSYAKLLPNAMFIRNWSKATRLRIFYRTSVNTPSISQLQTVVDNTDPLKLTTGNLGLDQSYQHSLIMRFNTLDSTKTKPFFALLSVQSQPGRISDVTFVPTTDSTLAGGTVLPAGSQLTLPKNINGYVSGRAFANYGFPVTAIKSNMNLNVGGSVERLPGEVNGAKSLTWNTNWNLGTVISSNISQGVDFNIGYTANYNTARSDLRSDANNDYYEGQLTAKLTLNGLKGWLLENQVNYQQYIGLGAAYDQHAFVWNAAIGHKFLKNDALEFRVSAYDILNRNVSVTRDVGDTYIQNTVTNVLQRYVMFSLRLNLSAFKGAAGGPPAEAPAEGRHGDWGPPPGAPTR